MLHSILNSQVKPAILIPLLEEMIALESLMQSEHKRMNNDIEYVKSEVKIIQLDMLLCLMRFKATA